MKSNEKLVKYGVSEERALEIYCKMSELQQFWIDRPLIDVMVDICRELKRTTIGEKRVVRDMLIVAYNEGIKTFHNNQYN